MNLKHAAAALALTKCLLSPPAPRRPRRKKLRWPLPARSRRLIRTDASDTLSQTASKSFYEGLFTFDKDMKVIDALATDYKVSDDGLRLYGDAAQGREVP